MNGRLLRCNPERTVWKTKLELRGPLTLGRDPKNDIIVPHPMVSASHAQIRQDSRGLWRIRDNGSTNGTWVNEVRVRERVLLPGDTVMFSTEADKFVFATREERIAIMLADGTAPHRTKLNKIADELEKRGFTCIVLMPNKGEGKLLWDLQTGADAMPITNWIKPFTIRDYNQNSQYILLYCSGLSENSEEFRYMRYAVSIAISTGKRALLADGYGGLPRAMEQNELVYGIGSEKNRMDNILLRELSIKRFFGFGIDVPLPNGVELSLPARIERKWGFF